MIGSYPNARNILEDEFFEGIQKNSIEGVLKECYRLLREVTLYKNDSCEDDRLNARSLRCQIENFYPSDGDLFFNIRLEYDRCNPEKSKNYDSYKCELFVLINLVMAELWIEDNDCDVNQVWYHLLRARATIQILIDARVVQKKGRLIKFPEDAIEGCATKIPKNRGELHLLKMLIVELKPEKGWVSYKQLASLCEKRMEDFYLQNKLTRRIENLGRNIGDWIRKYPELDELYRANERPSKR